MPTALWAVANACDSVYSAESLPAATAMLRPLQRKLLVCLSQALHRLSEFDTVSAVTQPLLRAAALACLGTRSVPEAMRMPHFEFDCS
jgi:hypothetical protein